LEGILQLQQANLRKHLQDTEAAQQGFLIAEYTLEFLGQMHASHPSIVALDGERVVGYALVVTQSVKDGHPLLADLCSKIDELEYEQQSLRTVNYVVVGQLCIDKDYRGLGLVQQLYGLFRQSLQSKYRYAITDIAQANTRSLQAHLKTGFKVIHSIEFEGLRWDVVLWDWSISG
jgi:ribosomal protein S18 acetylase RimI-like enzyme